MAILLYTTILPPAKGKDIVVKIKKQICYINDIPYAKWDCKHIGYGPCVVSSFKSTDNQITINSYHYMKMGRVYENKVWVDKELQYTYYSVKFLKEGKETYSNQTIKKIFEMTYKSKIFNEDGSLNNENVNAFINTYGEEKPNVVIVN